VRQRAHRRNKEEVVGMTETVTDPICGMTIDPDGAVASEKHAGRVRPVLRSLAWLVVLAVAVTACGDGSSDEVASFQEIATAGPSVEPDPSGTAAVLSVETSIDAVCAVSYGIGEPVGRIATDREMNPEGHSLHRVVLSGLEPDTEYSYRLQGVGSDGRLYRSDVFRWSYGGRGELGVLVQLCRHQRSRRRSGNRVVESRRR
jgi:hypothetical protein